MMSMRVLSFSLRPTDVEEGPAGYRGGTGLMWGGAMCREL